MPLSPAPEVSSGLAFQFPFLLLPDSSSKGRTMHEESCPQLGIPETPGGVEGLRFAGQLVSLGITGKHSYMVSKEVGKNVGLHWDLR